MKWVSRRHVLCFVVLVIAIGVAALPGSALAAVPANDDFANAEDLGSESTVAAIGSNLWATAEAGEPSRGFGPAMGSVWYRWTAPQNGVVRVNTCRANFDTTLAVYRGPAFGALGRVAASDDSCDSKSDLRFFAVAGTTYHIAVGGFKQVHGSFELQVHVLVPPWNDDIAYASDLGNRLTASASDTNVDATVEPREPDHRGVRAIASVWYRWTAPASGKVQVETCNSDFDTVIAVYVGPGLGALRLVASNDDSCGARSTTRFNAVAGRVYRIAVAGFRDTQGSIKLRLQLKNDAKPTRERKNSRRR